MTSREPGAHGPSGSSKRTAQVPLARVSFAPEVPVPPETATFYFEDTLNKEQGAYGPSLPEDVTMFISTEGLQTVHQSSRHKDERFVPTLSFSWPECFDKPLLRPLVKPPYQLKPFSGWQHDCPYFKWMTYVPSALRDTLSWSATQVPSGLFLVLLYPGKQDGTALDDFICKHRFSEPISLICVELDRTPSGNVLDQNLWDWLCTLASMGRVAGVLGGPMCRTWSVRRFVHKPGGGPPLRSREGDQAWGMAGLSEKDSLKVFGDNQLLLRQMYLSSLCSKSSVKAPAFLLEHPSDPSWSSSIPGAPNCSSIWILPAVTSWLEELSLVQLHFDQCMLGQKVPKTTTLLLTCLCITGLACFVMRATFIKGSIVPMN